MAALMPRSERAPPAALLGLASLTGLSGARSTRRGVGPRLAAAAACAKIARGVDEAASRRFAPYAGWVALATLLNEEIVRRDPGPARGHP